MGFFNKNDLTTRLVPNSPREGAGGTLRAEAPCPKCRQWTQLDARFCDLCGRALPWIVTHWPQIVAERRRQGLIRWVEQCEYQGIVVDGHHFDWGDPIVKLWQARPAPRKDL